MLQSSIFAQSPSFNSYSSNNFAEIAAKVCEEFIDDRDELGLEPVDSVPPDPVSLPEEETLKEDEESVEQSDLTEESQPEPEPEPEPELEVVQEEQAEEDSGNNGESGDDDDFEFTFVCRDPDGSPISADEIFANGQIRPVFPVFNRDLLFAGGQDDDSKPAISSTLRVPLKNLFLERDSTDPPSSSSSEADELENLPEGTYCVWTPKGSSSSSQASPETCKKSRSTGSSSSSRRWRFRDFLFRSNSDGKDTFVFLTPSGSTKMKTKDEKAVEKMIIKAEVSEERKHSGESKVTGKGKSEGVPAAVEASPAEIHYMRNRALKESDRRRSYLPYRKDLVGFFANVDGLSRNLHPF